jgi:hypothetical protein
MVLLLSGWVDAYSGGAHQAVAGTGTSIIMIRHAERTEITKTLTVEGHVRAQDLVKAVADMNISAIYSPDLERNLDTVKPLAQHLGIEVTVTPTESTPLVNQIVDEMLDKHAGKTVLWVGNMDNLRKMYWRLGGDGEGPIEYGDLFIMKITENAPVSIVKTHFGM